MKKLTAELRGEQNLSDGTSSALAILFARFVSITAGVIQLPVVAHMVDRNTFSTVSTILATGVFISLIGFEGTILAFQRFPNSRTDLTSYSYSHRRLVLSTFLVTFCAGVPAALTQHGIYALALVGWGCGLAWMRFVSTAWLMWLRPWHYAWNLAASTLIRTGVLIGTLAVGVHAAVALTLAGFASVAIALLLGPRANYENPASRERPWPKGLAMSLALASTGVTLLSGADRMLAGFLLGGPDAASYLAMAGIGSLSLGSVLSLINMASYPQLIKCWQRGQESCVSQCIGTATTWTIVAIAAALALASTAGGQILLLLFPGSYVETRLLLGVFVATGLVALGLVYSWTFHLATAGKALRNRTAVSTAAMLVLVIVGGKVLGPHGLCLGLILGSAIYCLRVEAFPRPQLRRSTPIVLLGVLGWLCLFDAPVIALLVGCVGLVCAGRSAGNSRIDIARLQTMAQDASGQKDGLILSD